MKIPNEIKQFFFFIELNSIKSPNTTKFLYTEPHTFFVIIKIWTLLNFSLGILKRHRSIENP